MKKTRDYCRLCMKTTNLRPIFIDVSRCERYSTVLELTTGLLIRHNDDFPQKICTDCTKSVNQALKLRNQCHRVERELKHLGFKRKKEKKVTIEKEEVKTIEDKEEDQENDGSNEVAVPDLEVEVEFDRITELKNEDLSADFTGDSRTSLVKKSRKEIREEYLKLVDGTLDPNGPVTCKICKKVLSKWTTFVNHAQLHMGFKFVCEFCGKSFVSSFQLNRHCRSQHGMERVLRCQHCAYKALDNAQLILHVRRVHTGARPFSCQLCPATYHSKRCLTQHMESHNPYATVQCDSCPQLFKSRRHLARHKYTTHTSKNFVYKCPICSRDYRNRKYIAVHLKKAHGVTTSDVNIIKTKL